MLKRLALSVLMCICLLPFWAVSAQEAFYGSGVSDGDLYIYTLSKAINLTQDGLGNFGHIAWYGNVMAFSRMDSDGVQNLWISVDGQTPFVLVSGLDPFYPFSFTQEGNLLFATNTTAVTDSQFMTDVLTIAPEDGASPQLIGQIDSTIAVIGGCGGGSPLPIDWQYWNEAGFGGRHHTLAQTPFGVVYTLDCTGGRTALLNLETNAITELGENFGNVALSSNQTHLVGTVFDSRTPDVPPKLAVVDLATATLRLIETETTPDQAVWSASGDAVFYTIYDTLPEAVPMTEADREALSGSFGAPGEVFAGFPLYAVSIHRFDLTTGEDNLIYTAPETTARIGRIFVVNERALVFTEIPNLHDWIAAVAEGQIDLSSIEDTTTQQLATVPVQVLELDLDTGELTEIREGINLFTPAP